MARVARRCLRTWILELIVLGMLASHALAQSEPVALDSRACTSVDSAELRRILALERSVLDAPGSLQVELRCDRDRAWLRAGAITRELALGSVPEALRPRLLALAIAELRPPEPVAAPRPQRFRLSIAAHGQLGSLAAAGAELGFSAQLRPWLAWSSGAAFTQGKLAIDRGDLRLRHASAFTGPALQRELASFTLAAGAGVRAGWLGLRGLPGPSEVRGQRFETWFAGPTAFGSGALRFARHGFALIALAATHTLREIHAEVRGGRTRTLSPWLASASVGVGASW